MVVSVERDMNAKSRRKVLNVAFKKFQRLPDWTRVKLIGERSVANSSPKHQAPSGSPNASQALAE
jgi:hypothetical protein